MGLHSMLRGLIHGTPSAPTMDFGRRTVRSPRGRAFRFLVVGGDIGGLSQARTCYETFGVRVSILARARTPLHSNSSMFEIRYCSDLGDADALVAAVNEVAALDTTPLLLLTSFDAYVTMIVTHREAFAENVVIPYTEGATIAAISDKTVFTRYAQELDLPYPRTLIHTLGEEPLQDLSSLGWPLIGKVANNDELLSLDWVGKEKVSVLHNQAEAEELVAQLLAHGLTGDVLFQERIPGADDEMRIFTCYATRSGKIIAPVLGHSVLEEHDPELRGNPALIITGLDPADVTAQATSLLRKLDWVGYANFDLKHDSRDDSLKFFELNPRLGRSNFYLNTAGINPITILVDDWIDEVEPVDPEPIAGIGLYTVVPLVLALAYGSGVRRQIMAAVLHGRVKNPLLAFLPHRQDLARLYYMGVSTAGQWRRFHRHYPLSQQREERRQK